MLYTYAILVVSSLIAVVAAGYVLLSLSRPEREPVYEPGVTYIGQVMNMKSGGNTYSVDFVKPPMASRWFLALCTVLFCFAVFYLLSRSLSVTHEGVEIPVEHLAENMAGLIENERPILIGRTGTPDQSIQDVALLLVPTENGWQIEIFGNISDIRESFIAPAGPFSRCDEVNADDLEFRRFRAVTTDPASACDWVFRNYLHYPDGTKMELSVTDGEAFSWRSRGTDEGLAAIGDTSAV